MSRSDPFCSRVLGALLALAGLLALMMGEGSDPHTLAVAAACLVGALVAFAVEALQRWHRAILAARAAQAALAAAEAAQKARSRARPGDAPEPAGPARGLPQQGVLAAVRIRRSARSR